MRDDPELSESVQAALKTVPVRRYDTASAWAATQRQLESGTGQDARMAVGNGPSFFRTRWVWGLAAAALFCVGAGGIALMQHRAQGTTADLSNASPTYITAPAERRTIHLPDGSTVTLNVASRLEVSNTFGQSTRTVRLIGEAAFVVHDAAKTPFIIEAGNTKTAVLGTEFGIRAYEHDGAVQVAVQSGRVNVDGVTLGAREIARFTEKAVQIQRDANVERELAFVHDQLVLKGLSLAEARPQIERWYDVELRFGTPTLAGHQWDAVLDPGAPADLAGILEFTLQARVEINGRVLTVFAR